MANQIYDPLFNFDFTKIGFRHSNVQANLTVDPKAIVTLTIQDSLIASTITDVVESGTITPYSVDVLQAIKDLNVSTGRYTLTVQPFVYSYYKQGTLAPSIGPANPLDGASVKTKFQIRRISDSRTELLVKTTSPLHQVLDGTLLRQYGSNSTSNALYVPNSIYSQILVHPKVQEYCILIEGQLYTVINAAKYTTADAFTAVLKLDRPVDDTVSNGIDSHVVIPFGGGYQVEVDLTSEQPAIPGTVIRPPDFTVRTNEYQIKSTNYLNRGQLLTPPDGMSSSSLQLVLDKTLSGSGVSHAELGIDYRKFENFVFFGSAQERLENFKYKLQKLEHYSESIRVLSASKASESYYNLRNTAMYESRSNKVLTSFDEYEKYLYYNSSSNETSSLGLYSASTWPKTNATYPYTNQKISDTEATLWFASQSLRALEYDNNNLYNLEKIIPVHVRVDDQNANFLTFVHMVGQHFDTLYTYVQHINKLYDRDERFNIGISKDILYEALGSLGWTAQSGYSIDELWSYYNGTPFSGSSYDTLATPGQHPTEDITKEIWNRTINNLPYLLKTRGTERGVKALLATYGMPSTLLQVSEYGGQSKEQTATTYYKKQQFNRSLQFTTESLVVIPHQNLQEGAHPDVGNGKTGLDTFEIRIKPTLCQDVIDSGSVIMHHRRGFGLVLEPHPSAANAASSMSNHARLATYYAVDHAANNEANISQSHTEFLPIYNGEFWNIQASLIDGSNRSHGTSNTLRTRIQCASDYANGKITHSGSSEIAFTGITGGQFVWRGKHQPDNQLTDVLALGNSGSTFRVAFGESGSTQNTVARRPYGFTGSMQEFRGWFHTDISTAAELEQQAFDNHTLNPVSIEGNSYTASYTDLLFRFPLGTDNNIATTTNLILSSSHPNFNNTDIYYNNSGSEDFTHTFASFSGFTGTDSEDWSYEEESYFVAMPDIVGNRAISDKIRIDSSPTYSGQLHRHSSSLSSSIKLAGPDSPIVGVHFSPSHHIDLDMASQLGGSQTFDDFVGNPRDTYRSSYRELRHIRDHYWQKYSDRPTFQAYMNVLKYFDASLFKQIDMMLPGRAIKQVGLEIRPTLLERNTIAQRSMSFSNDMYDHSEHDYNTDDQRSDKAIKILDTFSITSTSIALSEAATGSDFGTINPTIKSLQPFDQNYAYDGYPTRASSYVTPFTSSDNSNFFQIGEHASNEVPLYTKMRQSKRFTRVNITYDATGSPISRSFVVHHGQDFRATALERLYFDGCKIGSTAGSIGGVIQYRGSDNTLTYPGIIPGILAAVEVVETNPNTVAVQSNPTTIALPELQVR